MNWCFKVPEYKQVHKFTQDNMVLHAGHLFYTNTNDWSRYVFLDEVHFNSRDLRKRRVLGPRNERVHVTTNTSLSMSFSMSAMVRCDGTFFLSPYRDTNDQYNARDFILESIRCGFLKKGDILFMDNAAVHLGSDTFPVLCLVLEELQITLKFLPAYSPELNPIELCFGYVKNFIRTNRSELEMDLHVLVALGFILLSKKPEIIAAFFKKAIRKWEDHENE